MKDISGNYKEIFADPNHWAEHRALVHDVEHGMGDIVSIKTPGQLFDSGGPGIGSAVSREMEMEFFPKGDVPVACVIKLETRIASMNEQTGETISDGHVLHRLAQL